MNDEKYAGFWVRFVASVIDSILISILILPILLMVFGQDYFSYEDNSFSLGKFLINYVLPAVVVIVFWIYKSATPGKMVLNLTIVDAETGGKPSNGQLIGRYLAYYVSMLPLFLGFIWVAFDPKKQGWHDKLARTLVIVDTSRKR